MDNTELKIQSSRCEAYRKLQAAYAETNAALAVLNTPFGYHNVSAFTGNTRESRKIVSMSFSFSHTFGGEAPVELAVTNLHLPASEVGDVLRKMLSQHLKFLSEQMASL